MQNNRIETARLILRPWREGDASSLYKYAKDPAVGPTAGWQPHRSARESLSVIQNLLNRAECYAICEKENEKAILYHAFTEIGMAKVCNMLCFPAVDPAYRRGHIAEKMIRFMLPRMNVDKPIAVTTYREGAPEGAVAGIGVAPALPACEFGAKLDTAAQLCAPLRRRRRCRRGIGLEGGA